MINKINPNNNPIKTEPVEDVLSEVSDNQQNTPDPVPQNPIPASPSSPEPIQSAEVNVEPSNDLNISESAIGQVQTMSQDQKNVAEPEAQIMPQSEIPNKDFNMGKILFYLILALIIIIGGFAIWALVF